MKMYEKDPSVENIVKSGLTEEEVLEYVDADYVLSIFRRKMKIIDLRTSIRNLKMELSDIECRVCDGRANLYMQSLLQSLSAAKKVTQISTDIECIMDEIVDQSQSIDAKSGFTY